VEVLAFRQRLLKQRANEDHMLEAINLTNMDDINAELFARKLRSSAGMEDVEIIYTRKNVAHQAVKEHDS